MKGMIEEMFYFIVIILAVFGLFVFFMYERGTKGLEVMKSVEQRGLTEEVATLSSGFFNSKLPGVEKSSMEGAIDSMLQGNSSDMDAVWYGVGIGQLNMTEIIPPLLVHYSKDRLQIVIVTHNATYVYGRVDARDLLYTYEVPIPIPEERVGRMIVRFG